MLESISAFFRSPVARGVAMAGELGEGAPEVLEGPKGQRVNECSLLIGPPGSGKTSLMSQLTEKWLKAGAWALLHDPNRDFAALGPWYARAEDFEREFYRCGSEGQPLHPCACIGADGRADAVVELAMRLGERINRERAQDNKIPIVVGIDESSALADSGSTFIGARQQQMLAQRRHLGIVPIYNLQRATMLTAAFYDMSTDVYIFQQTRGDRAEKLERDLSLERGTLGALYQCGPFRFAHWKQNRGDGRPGLV